MKEQSDFNKQRKPNLLFMHLPKTGGRTIEHWLSLYFNRGESIEILPGKHYFYETLDAPILIDEDLLHLVEKGGLFIHGHAPFVFFENLKCSQDYIFTVVRDPVERILSFYNYLRTDKVYEIKDESQKFIINLARNMSFERFVEVEHPYLSDLSNHQFNLLSTSVRDHSLSPPEKFISVKESLIKFNLVGDFDQLQNLSYVIAYELAIMSPGALYKHNKSDVTQHEVTKATRSVIHERNEMDSALHAYAKNLFKNRFNSFMNSLIDANSSVCKPLFGPVTGVDCWEGSNEDGFSWDFFKACQGRNFYNLETTNSGSPYRFTGEGDAEILLPLPSNFLPPFLSSTCVRVFLIHAVDPLIFQNISIQINGQLVDCSFHSSETKMYFELFIKNEIITTTRFFRLTFKNKILFRPREISADNRDNRLIGLAITGLFLFFRT
jgi:hypothetical protein